MNRIDIAPDEFNCNLFHTFAKDWLLLCAGDFADGNFNMMTVSWGSLGVIWNKPFAMVLVRPQRHTAGLIEKYPTVTLSVFPESCRAALNFCGSKSGRDYPKKAESAGLTPIPSTLVRAPGFAEAELILECRKTYASRFLEDSFADSSTVSDFYPGKDFHQVYFVEILRISGTEKYKKS